MQTNEKIFITQKLSKTFDINPIFFILQLMDKYIYLINTTP